MTLPYPHEVETGQLKPRRPAPRAPFDVEDHIYEAIRPAGDDLEMFGVHLPVSDSLRASEIAWEFREALTTHLQERRPDADEATWELFESQARALVERHGTADDEMLRVLLMCIDGL